VRRSILVRHALSANAFGNLLERRDAATAEAAQQKRAIVQHLSTWTVPLAHDEVDQARHVQGLGPNQARNTS
jgi:hypothetical protein